MKNFVFDRVSNFSINTTKSTSQPETLPGKRDNIYPCVQNKITSLGEMFSHQPRLFPIRTGPNKVCV